MLVTILKIYAFGMNIVYKFNAPLKLDKSHQKTLVISKIINFNGLVASQVLISDPFLNMLCLINDI